jgi:integrase
LRAIQPSDFDVIKDNMLSEGYARSTVNTPVAAVLYVLRRAKEEGLLAEVIDNPVSFVVKKRNIYLTDNEIKRLFSALYCKLSEKQYWFEVYVHLQLNTFARIGELLALDWADIDLDKKTISIHKQIDADTQLIGPTKNNRIHTALPLSDDMVEMLRKYKVKCGFIKCVFPNAHYFSKGNDSKNKRKIDIARMRRSGVFVLLKKIAVKAGIDPSRLSSHVLRKTGGDRLLRSGFSIQQVAHALRIDAKTVLSSYSTIDENEFEAKLERFELVNNDSRVSANDNVEELSEVKSD